MKPNAAVGLFTKPSMFDIEHYNYELPPRLIAQAPVSRRDCSRLLVVNRIKRSFSDTHFFDLPTLLRPGDLLVINNTRVVPARLFGWKKSGGQIEILVLDHPDSTEQGAKTRSCLLKSSKPVRKGALLYFDSGVLAEVREVLENGLVKITFSCEQSIDSLLEEKGYMPLPPYIKRGKDTTHAELDKERYQTVYSENKGAVAAPTAGLHFTWDLITKLNEAGILIAPLTLHVGYGTFRPVRVRDIRKHRLGEERYRIDSETVELIKETKARGDRVVAVGTTAVRALESAVAGDDEIVAGEGKTDLLITPGFSFKVVDALITNFHLPKSSLLFLVSAIAGLKLIREAYTLAIAKGYRFYSYGDAMLIL